MRVVAGVSLHFFRERTPCPVGFLRTFIELHAEVFFHQAAQAELLFAEQPRWFELRRHQRAQRRGIIAALISDDARPGHARGRGRVLLRWHHGCSLLPHQSLVQRQPTDGFHRLLFHLSRRWLR